ncbi:RNA polymerase sigma factor [Paenibacillus pinihumi]|uniref:RNA polymerase sigma factor n=1 Tax=Paenibacillus pinihumi TaxID=669462 RepID=UPI000421827F|nr:RNA polymerase sigma factor [Paenibacillus pinihumi]
MKADMERFEQAVAPYLTDLQGYCSYLTASGWDAEDLYQETMLRLLGHFKKTGKVAPSKSWIITVARNIWIDQHRKNKGLTATVPIENMTFVVQSVDYVSIRITLEWITEYLSDREIRMLILYEVYRYTYREIAEAHSCTVSTVKMVLYHAKQKLKVAVESGKLQDYPAAAPALFGSSDSKRNRKPIKRTYQIDYWTQKLVHFDAGIM